MDNLTQALEQTVLFLGQSKESFWSALSVPEIIRQLEDEIHKINSSQLIDPKRLGYLFAPTGCMQDISIDNGWADEFVELSKIVDQYT